MHIHHYLLYTTNTATCFTTLPIYTTYHYPFYIICTYTTTCFTPQTLLLALHHYPFTPHIPLPMLIHHYLLYTTHTTTCFTSNTHTITCFTHVPILHHTHHYPLYITQYYPVYITVHTPLPALHYTHCNLFFIMLYTRHHYLLYTTCTHAHTHKPHCFYIVCFGLTLVVKALQILLYITKTCVHGQMPAHTDARMHTHTKLLGTCASIYLFVCGHEYRIVLVYRMIQLSDINITIPTTGYFFK